MRLSLKIGSILGIPVKVHVTFLLLLGLIAITPESREGSIPTGLSGVILVLLIFGCVFLHELGHSITAKRFGIKVESITLLPIGGVAALGSIPSSAGQELLIASAGPLVSIFLGILFGVISWFNYGNRLWSILLFQAGLPPMIIELATINLFLAAFNLIPAFPMDGGRILRGLLWIRGGLFSATRTAVIVGKLLAGLFFVLGIISHNFMLSLIAIFVYFSSEAEGKAARWREGLAKASVGDVLSGHVHYIASNSRIKDAFEIMKQTDVACFMVLDSSRRIVGAITRDHLLQAMKEQLGDKQVRYFMVSELIYCSPFDNLLDVLYQMNEKNLTYVLVMENDQVVGVVTPESIGRIRKK
jgi:Zn-dependent protease/CBS domain-containing protein